MIVLDTNVLSEPMKPNPDPAVVEWIDRQNGSELFTTSTVIAELAYGISRLADGRRRQRLADSLDRLVTREYLAGIFTFDLASAMEYGVLVAEAEHSGASISIADAQIAAVCRVRGAGLATRNVKHFAGLGLELVNPWR
jgi:predicted nucleic acid-binding protein